MNEVARQGTQAGARTVRPGVLGLSRLTVTAFRNYARARLDLAAGVEGGLRPVVLTGPNGAGKTNLLEAVSFLAPGRGLRRAVLTEVTRTLPDGARAGPWAVAARLETPQGGIDIGTGLEEAGADPSVRRVVRVDGEPVSSQADLGHWVRMVWLTPQMDGLFREPASARRRFLDRLAYNVQPGHARMLVAYERAMRERNRLLREGRLDPAWLDGLEAQMAETGVAAAAARRETVARLAAALDRAHVPEALFPAADLGLEGGIEGWLDEGSALAAEDRLKAELARNRRRDAAAGVTTVGPHRTDLAVVYRAKGRPAVLCSTGEQKALLIGIVLAHARMLAGPESPSAAPPILLLDEVAAHLDPDRRAALFDELLAMGAQAWLTGTEAALFTEFGDRAEQFAVSDGQVARRV